MLSCKLDSGIVPKSFRMKNVFRVLLLVERKMQKKTFQIFPASFELVRRHADHLKSFFFLLSFNQVQLQKHLHNRFDQFTYLSSVNSIQVFFARNLFRANLCVEKKVAKQSRKK